MGRRLLPLACVLILLTVPAAAAPQWVQVRSPHFRVITDAGDDRGREVALRFEQMRGIFGSIFHRARLNSPVPLDIVAFRSQDGFMRYVPLANGKPVSLNGFLQWADLHNYIGIDVSSSDPYSNVSREYARLLLRDNYPVMPLWFESGFADYFSAIQIGNKQVQYGAVPSRFAGVLNGAQWLPVTSLLSEQQVSDKSPDPIVEAEAWLAVQYIMANNRLPDAFKYLHLAQIERIPVPDAMQQAFGVDAGTFEKDLRAYFASKPATTNGPLPDLNPQPYQADKINDLNAQAMLAEMHAYSKDYSRQALDELQAVLKTDPANEVANRGLGYLYMKNGKLAQAAQAFQKALGAGENDADLHLLIAAALAKQAKTAGSTPNLAIAMRTQAQRAIELDGSLAGAHDVLAYALGSDGKFDMAIQAEAKAIELDPSDESYQLNLAHLYIKAGRFDDGEAILKRIQTSDDPKIRDESAQSLASLKSDRDKATEQKRLAAMGIKDPTAPQWKMPADMKNESAPEEQEAKPDMRKTQYMTGQLESIACAGPTAVATVRSKTGKVMRLRTDDYTKLIVMGADEFSCDWRNKKVLVNYKAGGKADGDLVTLEVEQGK